MCNNHFCHGISMKKATDIKQSLKKIMQNLDLNLAKTRTHNFYIGKKEALNMSYVLDTINDKNYLCSGSMLLHNPKLAMLIDLEKKSCPCFINTFMGFTRNDEELALTLLAGFGESLKENIYLNSELLLYYSKDSTGKGIFVEGNQFSNTLLNEFVLDSTLVVKYNLHLHNCNCTCSAYLIFE